MIDFYRQLGRGERKAEALRQAQLDMIKSGQPPSSWAGFELDGEPDGSLIQRTLTDYSLRSSTR
jgi:CHAT domain-containing protein